jgi:monoamine oxidase
VLSRRRLLQAAAASAALAAHRGPLAALAAGPATREYDDGTADVPGGLEGDPERVVIVGAGWAGLTAANALRNAGVECIVVEGRRRIGGRAFTKDVGGIPVDLGCSWIHEPIGNPMSDFADQAGIGQTNADIEADLALIRFFDGVAGADVPLPQKLETFTHLVAFEEDIGAINDELGPRASARDGIRYYLDREGLSGDARRRAEFLLRLVVQQTDALDWRKLSLDYMASYEPVYTGVGQGNFPVGGYSGLVEAMAGDTDVRLGQRVRRIEQEGSRVRVVTIDRDGGQRRVFRGSHVIVTVPLGVLDHGDIAFDPGLPGGKRRAIKAMTAGHFEKVALTFDEPFWEDDLMTHMLHLSERVPLEFPLFLDLQRISGVPTLVGLCSAHFARDTYRLPGPRIVKTVLAVLEKVLGRSVPSPQATTLTRWRRDPFTRGSYSSIPVGVTLDACDVLAEPVRGRVLFAGEATSRARIGYSDGGLSTGIREAKRLLQAASVQISAG